MNTKKKQAFTLVEIMVVITVIAILMAASFKLMRAAAHEKKVAETKAKMERIQNALSGYYAYYGRYPDVAFATSLDPAQATAYDFAEGMSGPRSKDRMEDGNWELRAQWCARAQPFTFMHPPPQTMNMFIPDYFRETMDLDVVSPNTLATSIPVDKPGWNELKVFNFGLMSYLVPRMEATHFGSGLDINTLLYGNAQWYENNPATPRDLPATSGGGAEFNKKINAQRQAENEACARWLPHLEKIVNGGSRILGIDLGVPGQSKGSSLTPVWEPSLGRLVATTRMICKDAWGNEFFYHSMPPYQSYILWSAGANGMTYPPWVDSADPDSDYAKSDNGKSRKETISEWTKDDIVGGSM